MIVEHLFDVVIEYFVYEVIAYTDVSELFVSLYSNNEKLYDSWKDENYDWLIQNKIVYKYSLINIVNRYFL